MTAIISQAASAAIEAGFKGFDLEHLEIHFSEDRHYDLEISPSRNGLRVTMTIDGNYFGESLLEEQEGDWNMEKSYPFACNAVYRIKSAATDLFNSAQ